MPQIDWSIHLGDLILGVLGSIVTLALVPLFGFLRDTRDFNRDVAAMLRGADGKNGLVSDVKALKRDMYESSGRVSQLWHWIGNIRVGLATKGIATPDPE